MRPAPAARAIFGRLPAVDLATRQGHPQQVLVDGVGLLFGANVEAALPQVFLLVRAHRGVFLLDFADRGDDFEIAQRLHSKVETHLVVAHAGAAVRDRARVEFARALDRGFHDQIAIRNQQRILALVTLARPNERLDEVFPQRGAAIDGDVRGDAQFLGARLDVRTLLGTHAAGIGEHGVHAPTAFQQVRYAEAGVEATGKGENDVLAHDVDVLRRSGVFDDGARLAAHGEIDGSGDEAGVMRVLMRGRRFRRITGRGNRHHGT